MKRTWSKEPWQRMPTRIVDARQRGVCETYSRDYDGFPDANRIVECVNALTGVGFGHGVKGGEVRELIDMAGRAVRAFLVGDNDAGLVAIGRLSILLDRLEDVEGN